MPDSTDKSSTDAPRVSANQLAEFAFATNAAKQGIVRDQKYGNAFRAPYYQPALIGILGSFQHGRYDRSHLEATIARLGATTPRTPNHLVKVGNNTAMLQHFLKVATQAAPPKGIHDIVRRSAFVVLDGVWVSVRPEIITTCENKFSFTKLRFSKSKISADASELILQILIEFGHRQEKPDRTLDLANTRIIDCFAQSVILGHALPRIRLQQLHTALREYANFWHNALPPSAHQAAAGR